MRRKFGALFALTAGLLMGSASAALAQDQTISGTVNGGALSIGASTYRFAGSIDTVTFRGVQYINTTDHGREWQSASSFDGYGECFNPTQAGNVTDAGGSGSSSVVLSLSNAGNVLTGQTQMAFWTPPGYNYGHQCGSAVGVTTPQNTTVLSNHIVTQTVSIGYAGVANLIGYDTAFYVPENHSNGTFEAGTAYMPSNFTNFLTYDRNTNTLSALTATSSGGSSSIPVIISTSDGKNSLGMISAATYGYGSGSSFSSMWYEYYYFSGNTSKQGCAFAENSAITAGTTFNFSCAGAIGTVDEVVSAMNAYPVANPNTDIPIYRFHNGTHHFYSVSYTEGQSTNYYAFEGTDFHLFNSTGGGAYTPLYRCLVAGTINHFLSTSSNCEGYSIEGVIGYLSPSAASGLIPLYRFAKNTSQDHLITTNYSEGSAGGYTFESTLGYVPTT